MKLHAYTDVILDSINEGVFTIDSDRRITYFNRAAENITGVTRDNAIGHLCKEVFRASVCEDSCPLQKTLQSGEPTVEATAYIVHKSGKRLPIKISAAVLKDEDGAVIGGVETFQDLSQLEALRKKLVGQHRFGDIVGSSPAIYQLFDLLPQVANSESNVLIQGESGTGKELFARALHDLSPRKKGSFVAVNCGALPDTLLESELFGYVAGAFTDAKRDKPGRFALADGGTLFLDEIGDISPAMQSRLLRVLQERIYEPLGAVKSVKANVRVVVATNKDLKTLVAEGTFREDLFYRIHVVHLDIPPLRDRKTDIPLLIAHFVEQFNTVQGKDILGVTPEVMTLLMEHNYPGNVRELNNIIEHAFVLCHDGLIQVQHLPSDIRSSSSSKAQPSGLELRMLEKIAIEEALRRNQGRRGQAAQDLGINPSTLYRKIKALGIATPKGDGRGRLPG